MSNSEKFKALLLSPLDMQWPAHPTTAVSCIDAGLSLTRLKIQMGHGVFYAMAMSHGFTAENADAYVECGRRFGVDEVDLVIAAGVSQKLVLMLILDDAEVKALCGGEAVRGLALDKLRAMTPQEVAQVLARPTTQDGLIADMDKMLFHFRKLSPTARAHVIKSTELLLSANAAITPTAPIAPCYPG